MKAIRNEVLQLASQQEKDDKRRETGSSGEYVPFWELGVDVYLAIVFCIYHSELEGNWPRLLDLVEQLLSEHGQKLLAIGKRGFEYSRWQKWIPIVNEWASRHASDLLMLSKFYVFVFARVFKLENLKAPLRTFLVRQGEEYAAQWIQEVLNMLVLECMRQAAVCQRISLLD